MQPVIQQQPKNVNSFFAGLKLQLQELELQGKYVASLTTQGHGSILKDGVEIFDCYVLSYIVWSCLPQ